MMYYDKGQVPFEDGVDRMRYGRTLVKKLFGNPTVRAIRELEIPIMFTFKMG